MIGQWTYAGTGWATDGDRILALAAAARAREHDQWKAGHAGGDAVPSGATGVSVLRPTVSAGSF